MNKKALLSYLFTLFVCYNFYSQTEAERIKIASTYNVDAIKTLKSSLAEKNKLKESRISTYLNSYPNEKMRIEVNSKTYAISDIVNGKPIYITTHNIESAKATRTEKLHPGGGLGLSLEGEGMSIGVWDEESVRGTHNEFKDDQAIPQSRVIFPEFPGGFFGPISDHATHVAGTLLAKGVDGDAKGMAPKATLISYDWTLDDGEALNEASNGLLLSNHSYGVPIYSGTTQQVTAQNIGSYSSDARTWDQVAYNAPFYLAVKSAGNEGTATYTGGLGSSFDKLTGNKTAKNILVVANANPILNPSGVLVILSINSSSSQGPTDDFRIKPDIAGDGTNVYSPFSGSDSDYSTISGTSMASPNVAGSLLLLQEYYNQLNSNFMRASTLKGLVCHTAIDDNTRTGPDGIIGWGLLNAEDSALLIKDDTDGNALIREITLNDGDTYTYQFNASSISELRATISWTDPAGNVSSSPNNALTSRLINDLDLRLEDSNGTVFTPWKLDNTNVAASAIKGDNNVDNIERIDIDSPIAGNYTLTVSHKGLLTNGSQSFSIILTGADLTLSSKDNTLSNLKVWPIPASTEINIEYKTLPQTSNLILYNINGRLVFNDVLPINNTGKYTINTSGLSKGIYFLNITSGTIKYTKKIIIK